nr:hypothetical transcript [Hymenolepis microstoma]CUU97649.1 hypothetical transcript [Hymenolepis microstoma]
MRHQCDILTGKIVSVQPDSSLCRTTAMNVADFEQETNFTSSSNIGNPAGGMITWDGNLGMRPSCNTSGKYWILIAAVNEMIGVEKCE